MTTNQIEQMRDYILRRYAGPFQSDGNWYDKGGTLLPDFGCRVCGPVRWWQLRRRRDYRRGQGCVHRGAP